MAYGTKSTRADAHEHGARHLRYRHRSGLRQDRGNPERASTPWALAASAAATAHRAAFIICAVCGVASGADRMQPGTVLPEHQPPCRSTYCVHIQDGDTCAPSYTRPRVHDRVRSGRICRSLGGKTNLRIKCGLRIRTQRHRQPSLRRAPHQPEGCGRGRGVGSYAGLRAPFCACAFKAKVHRLCAELGIQPGWS